MKPRARLLPWLYLAILAGTNLYICSEAFVTESTGHWNSIHGQWMSLARIAGFDWLTPTWWPYWGGGAPLEFTYAPLIPMAIAAISRLFHCSVALALNQLTGLVYCLGPIAFYLLSWKLSRMPGYSFAAALTWSLISPAALLIPDRGFHLSTLWGARRLYLAFEWDDLPHLTSLTLVPLAVWSLSRALQSRRLLHYAVAVFAMSGMMLANMFGVVLAGLVTLTVPLAMERRFRPALLVGPALAGASAYVAVCPWLPPSLLMAIRANTALNGEASPSLQSAVALGIIALAAWIVWRVSAGYIGEWPARWMLLFGCVVILIPALGDYTGLHFLPQPGRYKIEAELAIVWIAVFALRRPIERMPMRALALIPLLAIAAWQALAFRRLADSFCAPADVKRSIEYRSAEWVEEHLPGRRVMMGGSLGNFLNLFTQVEQLSAQPYTTAPNWTEQVAVYTIYRGENAGERDGAYSVLWLKAFGAQAVAVPGPRSPEYWKPFAHPGKFDGLLPVLWREDDTTIYGIPAPVASLAHVMRPDQLVRRRPTHGLDVEEVRRYVAAMESPSATAPLEWHGANRVKIRAVVAPGDVISTQINYHPGWRATGAAVRADGLGLMVVQPNCNGECDVALEYDGGRELRLCRIASGAIVLLLLLAAVNRAVSKSPSR